MMLSRLALVWIIGLGLGWLIGLSQSPVIAAVVTALVAAAATLVGALGGTDEKASEGTTRLHSVASLISAAPLAALMMGLAIGAPAGLYARNAGLFAPQPADHTQKPGDVVAEWEALGIQREKVVARLFEREFPVLKATAPTAAQSPEQGTIPSGLVAAGAVEECTNLRRVSRDQLLLELRSSNRKAVKSLADALSDSPDRARLGELLLEAVCPPQS